ncbi:hypothetical protein FK749_004966, partial [Escherichia coli]|nr:hypothetical protein [Escherichia coli]EFD6675846.1 hypothetical protein [Escherichia coli]HAZ1873307.1 hypothetical protein [Escherichia coli O157]
WVQGQKVVPAVVFSNFTLVD